MRKLVTVTLCLALVAQMCNPIGNRLSQNVNGLVTNYAYNEVDQLLTAGTTQYQYDARGNLVKAVSGAGTVEYTFSAADRLTEVSLPDGTKVTHMYDADGRRVQQSIGSQTTNYLWDETSLYGDVVLEISSGNTTSYVLGGTELLSQTRNGVTSYYLHDGQGSVNALTNASADITDTYSYTAFGETLNRTGTTINAYQYTGQQLDSSTGLYDLRSRYYDPSLGRFLSQDIYPHIISDPAQLNRYVYVANNPINLIDPTGLFAAAEYSMTNNESKKEGAAAEPVGQTTADMYAKTVATEEIKPAMALRTQFFSPKSPIIVAKGVYSVNGEVRTVVTVNNFYTKDAYNANKLAVDALRREALRNGWEFEGGIFQQGANQQTALHAEQNMLNLVSRLGLDANTRVSVGVSYRGGLCLRCMGLGTEIHIGGARGILVELANDVRLIIMGVP